MKPAMQFAIVMAYEAFRICLGLPTRHYRASEVIRWMQAVARTHNGADHRQPPTETLKAPKP